MGKDLLRSGVRVGSPLTTRDELDHDVGDGDHGHGEQRTGDARDERSRGNREDDRERVHLHSGTHDERLQDVALDLLHQQHDSHHDERRNRAEVDEGDEDRDRSGQHSTDDGDEGTQEHRDRNGNDEREAAEHEAQDPRTQSDADGIHRCDEDLHLHERGEGDPASLPRSAHGLASTTREQTHDPRPDALAVDQDEQGREQGEQESGEHVTRRGSDRQRAGDECLAVFLDGCERLIDVRVDVGIVEVQGDSARNTLKSSNALIERSCKSGYPLRIWDTTTNTSPATIASVPIIATATANTSANDDAAELHQRDEEGSRDRDHERDHDVLELDDQEDEHREPTTSRMRQEYAPAILRAVGTAVSGSTLAGSTTGFLRTSAIH